MARQSYLFFRNVWRILKEDCTVHSKAKPAVSNRGYASTTRGRGPGKLQLWSGIRRRVSVDGTTE